MKLYDQADRWVKNAARTVYKNMTYENALRAVILASVGTNIAEGAGSAMGGIASGSANQVAGGLASGFGTSWFAASLLLPFISAFSFFIRCMIVGIVFHVSSGISVSSLS